MTSYRPVPLSRGTVPSTLSRENRCLGQNPVPPELKAQFRGDVPPSPLQGVPFLGHPTAGTLGSHGPIVVRHCERDGESVVETRVRIGSASATDRTL
jgi:hypothetical protein